MEKTKIFLDIYYTIMLYTELPLYKECYKLLLTISRLLRQMPKNYRHTLWNSIFEETSQLVICIFKANTQRGERKQHLAIAREKAELIHVLLRLMRDLHCISLEEFVALQPPMETIGKQLTWWHRYS